MLWALLRSDLSHKAAFLVQNPPSAHAAGNADGVEIIQNRDTPCPPVPKYLPGVLKAESSFPQNQIFYLFLDFVNGFSGYETVVVQSDELFLCMKVVQDFLHLSEGEAFPVAFPEGSNSEGRVALLPNEFSERPHELFSLQRGPRRHIWNSISRISLDEFPLPTCVLQYSFKEHAVEILI